MPKDLSLSLGDALAQDISRAVTDAFGMTFGMNVKAGAYEISKGSVSLKGDVSGVVGVFQNQLEGTMTLCLKTEALRRMLPSLLGPDVEVTNEIAMDAVGEITNMIFGRVKTELNQRGHQVRFGMPSVIRGSGHFIGQIHQGQYMIIPFEVEDNLMQVHFALHPVES